MNILTLEHISKVFGDKVIFDDVSAGIQDTDKIGIIGINGTGKTTLLRMIAGLEESDEGEIIRQNGLRMAYLPQNPEFPEGATVLSYVSAGNQQSEWNPDTDAKMVLNRLGIFNHEEEIAHLSGGQKKRIALARILVNPADLLILDEPTNHLDNEMATWLEDYLKRFKGAMIMVTHDRYFLDRVTNKIMEISHGKLYLYEANYSEFLERKAEREEIELATERKRQSILRIEEEWAKRGCRARTTKQKARLERLEALRSGKAPVRDDNVEMDSIESRMGKKTIELHHVSKSFENHECFTDFDYIILRNSRLGIIGANGCGKSTLLKLIAGEILPDDGYIEIGDTIKIGYFSQEIEEMNSNERVIDYIKDVAEFIPTRDGLMSAAKLLERFLFDGPMQYTPIGKLSGGEKKRLYLLKVLAAAPNVLLLDEITNDLDIPTLTILEDYLDSFSGIVVAVSHDRYFLDNLADRIFAFEDGRLVQYEGGYTDYLEERERRGYVPPTTIPEKKSSPKKTADSSSKDWKQNRKPKLKFTFKEQREYETIDEDIAKLEGKIAKLEADILKNATNSGKLNELTKEKNALEEQLEEKMDRWVYLNDLAERIEQEKAGK